MSCNCGKNAKSLEKEKVVAMATNESNTEQVKYVVYEIDGKITYDRKECWEKDGSKGILKRIIYPV